MPETQQDTVATSVDQGVIPPEAMADLQERLKGVKTVDEVAHAMRDLLAPTLNSLLQGEMTAHLGYDRYGHKRETQTNSRNGYSTKTLKTTRGPVEIEIPRDRQGTFEPQIVPKFGRKTTNEVEEKVIALYMKGNTTRDIQLIIHDIYGVDLSPAMVSTITDTIEPDIREWRERPLSSVYPFVLLDGLRFSVRDNGRIINKCAYMVLGVNIEGKRDLLGIWLADEEGAKFWMSVLNDIKNRGVQDIFICTVDGLKGFKDAIAAVFPKTTVQRCIVHMVRNTMRFVSHRHRRKYCAEVKRIYTAPSEQIAHELLEDMKVRWHAEFAGRYDAVIKTWENDWAEASTFFAYSPAVRKIIYTTNGLESTNRQVRKITKTTSTFPHDDALIKLLYLAFKHISRHWHIPLNGWGEAIGQLAIMYEDRFKLN